jgi:hypothetical protein
MDRVNSTITSNSWGSYSTDSRRIFSVDQAMVDHPDKLFVFSAGNYGEDGYMTVGSPGEAKNILTVGALNQLQVENHPALMRYILVTGHAPEVTTLAYLADGTPPLDFPDDGYPYVYFRNELNFTGTLRNRFA